MKKKTTKVPKTANKLLQHFGGKSVNISLKFSKSLNANPVVNGILLDIDEGHYYLGESYDASMAIPRSQVEMVLDANSYPVTEEEDIPPGTKIQ